MREDVRNMHEIDLLIERVKAHPGTLTELAKRSDISYSWLSKFARGKLRNPTLETIRKLDSALAGEPKQ